MTFSLRETSTYPLCWIRWFRELFLSTVAGVCTKLQEHRRVGFRGHELGSDGQVMEKEIWEGCPCGVTGEGRVLCVCWTWVMGHRGRGGRNMGFRGEAGRKWQRTCVTFRLGLPQSQGKLTVCAGGIAWDHCSIEGWEGLSKPEPGHLSYFSSTSVTAKETVIMLSLKWDCSSGEPFGMWLEILGAYSPTILRMDYIGNEEMN